VTGVIIVPNVAIKHPDGNGRDTYNPTEVIMKAATSILDMCWTIRLKIVPNCTDELQKIQDVVNTANVYLNELFAMKQWLLRSSKRMASIKAHGCAHIPWQMGIMGPHPFNDTDQCESSHVMDKTEYKRTSKRDESTNEEMLGLVSICVYVRVYKSI
jgi:hypothetical protein